VGGTAHTTGHAQGYSRGGVASANTRYGYGGGVSSGGSGDARGNCSRCNSPLSTAGATPLHPELEIGSTGDAREASVSVGMTCGLSGSSDAPGPTGDAKQGTPGPPPPLYFAPRRPPLRYFAPPGVNPEADGSGVVKSGRRSDASVGDNTEGVSVSVVRVTPSGG